MLLARRQRRGSRGAGAILLGALLGTLVGAAGRAHAGRMLGEIELGESKGAVQITVLLERPMRVVSHAPETRGEQLEIRLEPLAPAGETGRSAREALTHRPDDRVPLTEVIYEAETEHAASLLVRFTRVVSFQVVPSSDPRKVVIVLPDSPAAAKERDDLEKARRVATELRGRAAPAPSSTGSASAAGLPQITQAELDRLLADARSALEDDDYPQAIRLLTKLVAYPEHPGRAEAQELLGLARERNGQLAHAKAEYQEYLGTYPSGEGAERVRQRLAALVTAAKAPEQKLRAPKATADAGRWDFFGGVSQFYRRDETFTTEGGNFVDQSALASDASLTARRRSAALDLRAQATGGYLVDFLDASESEARVSELYLDGADPQRHLAARAGRQSRSTGGVLGRYDGGLLGWQALSWLRVDAVAGSPVEFEDRDEVATDRQLYGLAFDLGTFAELLDVNLFGIEQRVDGIGDRRAVGAEARYLDRHLTAFGLLDYDVSFTALNIALVSGTWAFDGGASLNLTLDQRLTPVLTTTNALIGQTADSISDLRRTYDEQELRSFARDRTATSRSASAGGSMPLTGKFRLAGDLTVARTSSTDASGGVEATPGTGNEFFYSTQLIGSGLLGRSDVSTLGLRYSDADTNDAVGVGANTRFLIATAWRLNPRLLLDYRWDDDAQQLVVRPSSRVEYQWRQSLRLELDVGGEWLSKKVEGQTESPWGYYVSAGYRWDF